MIHIIAFNLLFACCLVYGLRHGGQPEKAVVLSETAALILTMGAVRFLPHSVSFAGTAPALVMIDVILFIALTCISLRANRVWTIVLAGLQLSTVIVHVSRAAFPGLHAASYAIFEQFWAWPIVLTTLLGTRCHNMRKKKYGQERDWKPLWAHTVQAV